MEGYSVAVVGATGAVGTRIIKMLEADNTLPIKKVSLLASKRSAGKTLSYKGQSIVVEELVPESFTGIDIALFSAGGAVSKQFAPEAVKRGAIVIDNTSAFRMDQNVPLVVPEVNPAALADHQGIIANPNCSTIQMVVALAPIKKAYGLKRVITSTYQAVSGAGHQAAQELRNEAAAYLADQAMTANILPTSSAPKHFPIAFNALPQIDVFAEDDYTFEEWKMRNETRKIMGDSNLAVTATCVRVPVEIAHSESVYIEVEAENVTPTDIKQLMNEAPGVVLQDNPAEQLYPQALQAIGQKETFVGRIRRDLDNPKGFHLWIVSDNLLKGAAWNSVQIADTMYERGLLN